MATLAELTRDSAIEWLKQNTTLELPDEPTDENLTPTVKLFILKFGEVLMLPGGVTSESLAGASQSFMANATGLLKAYARELFGADVVAGDVSFTPAVRAW